MTLLLTILLNFNGTIYELESFDYDYANNAMTITATADLIFNGGFENG